MRSLLAPVFLAPALLAQSTWHVDVHAPEPGDGSIAAPFARIQYALDRPTTLAGDTLLVAPGIYDERLVIAKDVRVIASAGPLATVVRPSSSGTAVQLSFSASSTSGPTFEGFTVVRNGGFTAAGVAGTSGTVRRCIVDGRGDGVGLRADYDLRIERCLVFDAYHGVLEVPYVGLAAVRDTIAVGNVRDLWLPNGGSFSVDHCCYSVANFAPNPEDVLADPLVRDLAGHDFHLGAGSPCIDAGNPASAPDPDGSRADIGPLPFDAGWSPFSAYCTATVNSLGCSPSVSASGTPSVTGTGPFTVTCAQQRNNKLGFLSYSLDSAQTPYQGGFLCLRAPVTRTFPSSSGGSSGVQDCSGTLAFDFGALLRSRTDPRLEPGREVSVQFWSRDPQAPFGGNRSNALRLRLQP